MVMDQFPLCEAPINFRRFANGCISWDFYIRTTQRVANVPAKSWPFIAVKHGLICASEIGEGWAPFVGLFAPFFINGALFGR